jgi:tellurium resistance protein TerZ
MSISLQKGQRVSLAKRGGGTLSVVRMGLGWDAVKKRGLFGSRSQSIDLDASALLFDAGGRLVDAVWFRQLQSRDGSVQHTGDNLTGAGEGDDESVVVGPVPAARVDHADRVHGELVHRAGLLADRERVLPARRRDHERGAGPLRAVRLGPAQRADHGQGRPRRDGGWTMTAIGAIASGRTFQDLLPAVAGHL